VPEARKVGGVPEARKVGGVPEAGKMTETTLGLFSIFVLSVFIGFEVISKVSPILHTPLMSGANAIHGVILVGAILVVGLSDGAAETVLGFLAIVLATINVVGGFVVTDRMLEMFKGRRRPARSDVEPPSGGAG
jgi:H+-translocating NAD(P) transhydrogenase subunit alpha